METKSRPLRGNPDWRKKLGKDLEVKNKKNNSPQAQSYQSFKIE
jgi:hypothetical protein